MLSVFLPRTPGSSRSPAVLGLLFFVFFLDSRRLPIAVVDTVIVLIDKTIFLLNLRRFGFLLRRRGWSVLSDVARFLLPAGLVRYAMEKGFIRYDKLGQQGFAHAYADQYVESNYDYNKMSFEEDAYGYVNRSERINAYLGADNSRGAIYAACK